MNPRAKAAGARGHGRQVDCGACVIRPVCALNRLGHDRGGRAQPLVRERVVHRNDVLLEEGQVAARVRVVKLGTVFAYRTGMDGRQRPIGVVQRGSALGVFGLFGMPSQVRCVALMTGRVCEAAVADLQAMNPCSPGLARQVAQTVTQSFAALGAWSEVMRLPGIVNQLAYVLVLLAQAGEAPVVQLPSHSALADLLGTRRESIARALATLEREGGIRRHERKRCEVRRDRLLARIARPV